MKIRSPRTPQTLIKVGRRSLVHIARRLTDELITKRLKDALDLVDIRVLDHIIIAGGDAISLSERGLL
jgi:hypothetical protein